MSSTPTCRCVADHSPTIGTLVQVHHVRPLSWGGPRSPENEVALCPNAHELVHRVLNVAVRKRGWPTQAELPTRNRYLLNLAYRAISEFLTANGGAWPTKYTMEER